MSNALPQTPHPSAENNQSRKIKALGNVKIGYMPRINKRFRDETAVILLTWNQCSGKDWVIYHWSKKCICHVKAGVAKCTAAGRLLGGRPDGKSRRSRGSWAFLFLDEWILQIGHLSYRSFTPSRGPTQYP